jgi:hypothetical protein
MNQNKLHSEAKLTPWDGMEASSVQKMEDKEARPNILLLWPCTILD